MAKFYKGMPRPAGAGRKKGTPKIAPRSRSARPRTRVPCLYSSGCGTCAGHGTWLDADVHPWPATTRGAADNRSPSASAGSLARSKALESFLGS